MPATIISKAQMASTVDSSMPNIYFVICSDDGYIYKYDKSNTVDSTTGRYRKYTSPGNSNIIDTANEIMKNYSNPETIIFSDKELNDLGDVTVSSPSNGQVLTYNSTTDKWENGAGGGTGGSGGHTIEDAEGTELTQRETMQFGEGFIAEDDDTNEKTVISLDEMPSEDMSEIVSPKPVTAKGGHRYSTEEQISSAKSYGSSVKPYISNSRPRKQQLEQCDVASSSGNDEG